MKYFRTIFNIICNDEALLQPARELLADACGECGYESFEDTDEGIIGYIQQEHYADSIVKHALSEFPLEGVQIDYLTEEVPDHNWNEVWEEQGFEPICVNGMVTIYDAHHIEGAEAFSTPITIGIQARNAFGTGNHETTRMIVATLLELPLQERRVLDCGTGTGILAIAAVRCGAKEVVGYDIDEWSVENAKHNAVLNGVGDQVDVLQGDVSVLSHIDGIFDVVLANINRNVLLHDMPHFMEVLAQKGIMVLSGFYEADAPMLMEKARELNLEIVSSKVDNKWCCLCLKKE